MSYKQSEEKITFKKIIFRGLTFSILERKHLKDNKPKYYLFNIENKYYLSSLYETGENNTYYFDVRDDGKYLLKFNEDGTYKIEEL
ncbi:MAG TPA: hypothetical protein PLI22_04415 [Caldisericia bacterium]|nr:hypothetical protein [Caldisericia bacterium]